ncbi:MAG: phage head closure protein [Bacillota bacterium]|nr:phage head closure protein [Bacillota bacterium]
MEAGKLRHQITIQVMNADELWFDLLTCHAQVNGLSGSEYWAASAEQAQNSVDFVVRYAADLVNLAPQTTRILFRGNRYDVKSIDNFMYQNRSLKLRAVMHHGR